MFEGPIVFGLVAIVGGAIAALSGFGIGSILTPFLILSFATADAVALVAIPHAVATLVRWFRLRHDVHRPTFKQFGIASALGGLLGAGLQPVLGSDALSVVLALLLAMAGTSQLIGRPLPLPPTPAWCIAGGAVSGAFGGLVGNQGGVRAAALLGFNLEPRALVATATAAALLVDAARVPIYLISNGPLLAATPSYWLMGSAGVIVGTFVGVPALGHIPKQLYAKLLALLLIALAGFMMFALLAGQTR